MPKDIVLAGRRLGNVIRHELPGHDRACVEDHLFQIGEVKGVVGSAALLLADDDADYIRSVHEAIASHLAGSGDIFEVDGRAAIDHVAVEIRLSAKVGNVGEVLPGNEGPDLIDFAVGDVAVHGLRGGGDISCNRIGDHGGVSDRSARGPAQFPEGVEDALIVAHEDDAEMRGRTGRNTGELAGKFGTHGGGEGRHRVFQNARRTVDDVAHNVGAVPGIGRRRHLGAIFIGAVGAAQEANVGLAGGIVRCTDRGGIGDGGLIELHQRGGVGRIGRRHIVSEEISGRPVPAIRRTEDIQVGGPYGVLVRDVLDGVALLVHKDDAGGPHIEPGHEEVTTPAGALGRLEEPEIHLAAQGEAHQGTGGSGDGGGTGGDFGEHRGHGPGQSLHAVGIEEEGVHRGVVLARLGGIEGQGVQVPRGGIRVPIQGGPEEVGLATGGVLGGASEAHAHGHRPDLARSRRQRPAARHAPGRIFVHRIASGAAGADPGDRRRIVLGGHARQGPDVEEVAARVQPSKTSIARDSAVARLAGICQHSSGSLMVGIAAPDGTATAGFLIVGDAVCEYHHERFPAGRDGTLGAGLASTTGGAESATGIFGISHLHVGISQCIGQRRGGTRFEANEGRQHGVDIAVLGLAEQVDVAVGLRRGGIAVVGIDGGLLVLGVIQEADAPPHLVLVGKPGRHGGVLEGLVAGHAGQAVLPGRGTG